MARVTELGSFMVPIGLHHWLGFGRGGEVRCLTPPHPRHGAFLFGRNSVPPGSFREIFGSSEPGDRCAHFELLIDFFCRRAKIGQNWAKLGLKLGRNPVWPLLGTFLAVTRRHRGVFGKFLAHWKRLRIAQLSYSRDFRWFGLLRPQFAIYWFLGGLRHLEKFCGPVGGPKWPFWP